MSTAYPGAIDTTNLTNPAAGNNVTSPDHAGLHGNENDAIKAVQTKIGTGSSTPVVSTLLFGTGTGTSAWTALTSAQLLATISDETGTGSLVFATTPTLVTPKVDTINEATGGNGTTIGGVNIKSGALNTNNSVVTTNITDSNVTSAKAATGFCVQQVNVLTSAFAVGTTIIPLDDTIPQNTEGDQYMSLAVTPKSATNILIIESQFYGATSAATGHIIAALFQDATASAIAAAATYSSAAGSSRIVSIRHTMAAGTTSATTFKIRVGCSGAGTTTFNGLGGASFFGAITKSSIVIREYKA